MSTLVQPALRPAPKTLAPRPLPAPETAAAPSPITTAETNRWTLLLVIPFVLGALFFALAIGLDTDWPIAPAFLLGPVPLIAAYIYLALSSDTNSE